MVGWLEEENERIEKEAEKCKKNTRFGDFLALQEGLTAVKVDLSVVPDTIKTKFGTQRVVKLVEPEGKCIGMSDYLFELFVKACVGKKGVVVVNIVRTGTGRTDTKYVVKAA